MGASNTNRGPKGRHEGRTQGMAGKYISVMVHFIWSTAGREPWIGPEWRDDLYGFMGGVMRQRRQS
jgi:hypothetical protein